MVGVENEREEVPPPKPPNGGGGAVNSKLSFRDKLLGAQVPIVSREKRDLLAEKLFTIELDDGDRLRPRCYIDKGLLEELRKPWKDAVIVTLLGKQIEYFTMREKLKAAWRLTRGMEMVDIGHGFFMVKFDIEEDKDKVIGGGPWIVFDHYVAVRPWEADFVASEVKINKTMVWIRFPSLGMEYYDENVLTALATTTGKPIRVDIRTIDASSGKFARVCVEIDLEQPVVGKVWFRDRWTCGI